MTPEQARETLRKIADCLQNEAEVLMKSAISRRESAASSRKATAKELREAKALAEAMAGRKLPLATSDVGSARENALMQDRIAEKLEIESRQLAEWSDFLLSAELQRAIEVLRK